MRENAYMKFRVKSQSVRTDAGYNVETVIKLKNENF